MGFVVQFILVWFGFSPFYFPFFIYSLNLNVKLLIWNHIGEISITKKLRANEWATWHWNPSFYCSLANAALPPLPFDSLSRAIYARTQSHFVHMHTAHSLHVYSFPIYPQIDFHGRLSHERWAIHYWVKINPVLCFIALCITILLIAGDEHTQVHGIFVI